jgi:acetyltransferase-like isoleucine patch superfamily enzyme
MDKIISEVPPSRLLRYALYRFVSILYRLLIFSPLQLFLLRLCGATIGRNVVCEPSSFYNLYVRGFRNLVIGDNVYIGPECLFDLANRIEIRDNATLAARVNIVTHLNVGYKDHPLQQRMPRQDTAVIIGAGAFVGTGTIILAGKHIGTNTFVGAGSLVHRSTEDNALYAGVPAKKISDLTDAL